MTSEDKDVVVALVSPAPEVVDNLPDPAEAEASSESDTRAVETRFNDFGWLFGQDPDHFSLELFSTTSHAMVRQFAETYPIQGPLVYFETEQGGRKWYFVLSGAYADMTLVREAAEKLPSELDAIRVRRFGVLQDIKCRLVDDLTLEEFARLEALCRRRAGG